MKRDIYYIIFLPNTYCFIASGDVGDEKFDFELTKKKNKKKIIEILLSFQENVHRRT